MLRLFIRSTRGNVALLFALLLPMILGAVGLAVDVANLLNVKTQLQNAADVGVLVASREGASDSQRRNLFDNYLKANFSENGVTIVGSSVDIEAGINHLRVDGHATANVESFFMRHLGMNQVSVVASTFRSTKSMEIAVVLDNTGSMGTGGINALKKASHALVDAVESARAPGQDVRLALVPFVTAVNIKGEGFKMDWIDTTGQSLYNGWNFLDADLRKEREHGVRRTRLPEGFGSNDTGSGYGGGQACTNQGQGASLTRPPRRRKNAHINQPTSGSTNSEWLRPRCMVISATGSSVSSAMGKESRSGKVPSAAPANSAARR